MTLDVFDTLLRRSVAHPTEAFVLMAGALRERGLFSGDPEAFRHWRVRAEAIAREEAAKSCRGEVTLHEIHEMFLKLPVTKLDRSLSIDTLSEVEMAVESAILFAAPGANDLLAALNEVGNIPVLVSDMYLTSEFISEVLLREGLYGFESVIVSSETGTTKASGSIFPWLRDRFGHGPWLHAGDNPRADIARALPHCDFVFHVRRTSPPPITRRRLRWPDLRRRRERPRGLDYVGALGVNDDAMGMEQALGVICLAPLLHGLCASLAERIRRERPDRILFFARDGLIIRRAMEILYPALMRESDHSYLFVSRKIIRFATMQDLDEDMVWFLSAHPDGDSARNLLARFGWSAEDPTIARALADEGLNADTAIFRGTRQRAYCSVIQAIEPVIAATAARERPVFLEYLESERLLEASSLLAVDIGWHGSMQAGLTRLLRQQGYTGCISGHYLGLYERARTTGINERDAEGYLFDFGFPEDRERLVRAGVAIIETMMSAPFGSLQGLRRRTEGERHGILPDGSGRRREVLSASSGFEALTTAEDPDSFRIRTLTAMQKAALTTLERMAHIPSAWLPEAWHDPGTAIVPFEAVVTRPSLHAARVLGRMPFSGGSGEVNEERLDGLTDTVWRRYLTQSGWSSRKHTYWPAGWTIQMVHYGPFVEPTDWLVEHRRKSGRIWRRLFAYILERF
ncbi:MAG: hypothetical protein AAF565_01105 [Pseudomonadota bacterium]